MKNRYRKTLPLILLVAALTGCATTKETVIDDVTGKNGAQQEAPTTAETTPAAVGADGQPIQEVIVPQETPVTEDMTTAAAAPKEGESSIGEQAKSEERKQTPAASALYTVHFDFDQYTINDTERPLLAKNAAWLESSPKTAVVIEGHADERGETEYNLALGDRRARSAKKFLQDLGIASERLSTISYGEEKPAVQGHDEDAWAQNRRAEFKVSN